MDDNIGNANGLFSTVPHVIPILLVEIMMQFLVLVSSMEFIVSHHLLDGMSSLFPLLLAMFYVLFFWVTLCGIFFIFPAQTTVHSGKKQGT
jgi:hypothetical protein